jgi:hypothetical protein
MSKVIDEMVFVLTEQTDDGFSVIGVYDTFPLAVAEKNAIIREFFDISEDEVSDDRLDEEVSESVTYDIVMREVVTK